MAAFANVTISNCVVWNCINESSNTNDELRGGGVYCDQGSLVGCYILENRIGQAAIGGWGGHSGQLTAYGGGCYLFDGTIYNCVIQGNVGQGQNTDGAGVFLEYGEFYNNTIVGNDSQGTSRGNGGICVYYDTRRGGTASSLDLYNCIVIDNRKNASSSVQGGGNKDIAMSSDGNATVRCNNSIFETLASLNGISYTECLAVGASSQNSIFVDYANKNFRLRANSPALNMGENIPHVNGKDIFLEDYTDMDFTARIKDCTVDAGAYELDNTENIHPTNNVFYVTEMGAGTADGSSPANAACEMKLQSVLTRAGEMAAASGQTYTVRVAEGSYEANTLSDPNDPQSYTYEIPRGVTLEEMVVFGNDAFPPVEHGREHLPANTAGGEQEVFLFPDLGQKPWLEPTV